MALSVFDFEDFSSLMAGVRESPPGRKRPYSLSELAKKLGYRSPRLFGMVLKGQRAPSERLLESLERLFKWNRGERDFVDLLVRRDRLDEGSAERLDVERRIHTLRSNSVRPHVLEADSEAILSEWHYLPVKQLVASPDFVEDGVWISRRLRGKLDAVKATEALKLLERVGILVRGTDKKLRVSTDRVRLTTQPDRRSLVARRHQAQMMQRAVDALQDLPPERREFLALTLRMKRSELDKAKRELRAFIEDFSARYFSASATDVFQFNLQLFPHSEES